MSTQLFPRPKAVLHLGTDGLQTSKNEWQNTMRAWYTKEGCVHDNLSILVTLPEKKRMGLRLSPVSNPLYYGNTFVQSRHLTRQRKARLLTRRTRQTGPPTPFEQIREHHYPYSYPDSSHHRFVFFNMDGLQLRDEAVRDRIRLAEEFLDPTDQSARSYRADIILMLNRGFRRLTVSLDEIRTHNRQLADGLLQAPFDYSQAFDQALKNTIVALPNRPARESSDDVVSRPYSVFVKTC